MLFWYICTFRNALCATSNFTLPTPHFLALHQPPPSHLSRVSLTQVVKALDVLYELLRSSPPREQVQTVLLEWGVEQLYSLLLNPSFGDEARERVFRVRYSHRTSA